MLHTNIIYFVYSFQIITGCTVLFASQYILCILYRNGTLLPCLRYGYNVMICLISLLTYDVMFIPVTIHDVYCTFCRYVYYYTKYNSVNKSYPARTIVTLHTHHIIYLLRYALTFYTKFKA
jgi:hypothetical protein